MKLRIVQHQIGRFNMMRPDEEEFVFRAKLVDDEGNDVYGVDGKHQAYIEYEDSDDPEEGQSMFPRDPIDLLNDPETLKECYGYASRVITSRGSLKGMFVAFMEQLSENYADVFANACAEKRESLEKRKERLERELREVNSMITELENEETDFNADDGEAGKMHDDTAEIVSNVADTVAGRLRKGVETYAKKADELKDGADDKEWWESKKAEEETLASTLRSVAGKGEEA